MIRAVSKACAVSALLLAAVALARPVVWQAPPEDTPPELRDSDGETVANACSACHSLDYITTQPRGKGAQFWRDSVTKMINVYGAPLAPDEATAVAEVLAKKFG